MAFNWNCQECDTDDDGSVKTTPGVHGTAATEDQAEQDAQRHVDRRHRGESWFTTWPDNQRHETRQQHAFCLHMARLDRSTRTLQAQWGNAADHSRAAFWLTLARAHRLALQEGDRGYGPDEDVVKDGITEAAWVQEVKDRENRR